MELFRTNSLDQLETSQGLKKFMSLEDTSNSQVIWDHFNETE